MTGRLCWATRSLAQLPQPSIAHSLAEDIRKGTKNGHKLDMTSELTPFIAPGSAVRQRALVNIHSKLEAQDYELCEKE